MMVLRILITAYDKKPFIYYLNTITWALGQTTTQESPGSSLISIEKKKKNTVHQQNLLMEDLRRHLANGLTRTFRHETQ